MTQVRRLGAVGAVLALAALITSTAVKGGPGKDDLLKKERLGDPGAARKAAQGAEDDASATRFSEQKVVTYLTRAKKLLWAWQLQPALKAGPELPRDYLVVIDTSASQNRGPLMVEKKLTEALVAALGPKDRAAIWTANLDPKKLTRTFLPKAELAGALKVLKDEYPSGSTNLNKTLTEAAAAFEKERGRQRVLLFLGDGMSVAGPLSPDDRARIADAMVKDQITFYPVPLGKRLEPINLHALANATGGKVVRLKDGEGPEEFLKNFRAALAVPVLYPFKAVFSADVTEAFPTKLPPLRADTPILVAGGIKDNGKLTCTVTGIAGGREVRLELSEKLVPAEMDNFFLAGLVEQWREQKDRPAVLQADRSLAYAYESNQLARAELVAEAEWALEKNKFDTADRLYDQALQLDPTCADAKAGKVVVKQLKSGKMTREQLRKLMEPKPDDVIVRVDNKIRKGKVSRKRLLALAQKKAAEEAGNQPPPPGPDLLEDVKRRQAIEDQRNVELVNDAVREARRLLRTNPDAARELLKRTRESIVDNPDVSERTRRNLAERLRNEVRGVEIEGTEIERRLADQAQQLALARERAGQDRQREEAQDRVRERVRAINALMAQARFAVINAGPQQDRVAAIRAAEQLKNDLIKEGQPVPPALTASYGIAQADFHLTELNELRRLREQRFLLTLLEVERRHIPFPDEPPIEFPPAARWKALTQSRKSKYETFRFGAGTGNSNLKAVLDELNRPRDKIDAIDEPALTLPAFLEALSKKFSRPGDTPPFFLQFDIDIKAFEAEQYKVLEQGIGDKKIPELHNTSLASYLRRILAERVPVPSGATYVIRKEADLPVIITSFDERDLPPPAYYVVEITTGLFAKRHKETVGFSVADLVVPIPNAVNSQAVRQSATLFGQFGLQGGVIGQVGAAGLGGGFAGLGGGLAGIGGIGGLGGGLAGIGGIGGIGGLAGIGGVGGLGGLGGLGGAGGLAGGVGGLGGMGGAFGQVLGGGMAGVGGVQNFGVGGGAAGFGGGQLGQFGNLGGQFGLQGGTQQLILMSTIRQLVGEPNDWAPLNPILAGGMTGEPEGQPGMDAPGAEPGGNQLGYFPTALALVVKGTSLIHTRVSRPVQGRDAAPPPGGMGALPGGGLRNGDVLVIGPRPGRKVAGAGEGRDDDKVAKAKPKRKPFKSKIDPAVGWQQALEQGINDPGLIVATADLLLQLGKYDHAAEFLKANLRQGIIIEPWVYEALAIALRESKASSEEIERAETSLADLNPDDADGFLKASKAMAGLKRYDRALAFCRQAALLAPNAPQAYAEALDYADAAQDAQAMEWAAGHLLEQDWPLRNDDLHRRALDRLDSLSKDLEGTRAKDAERLQTVGRAKHQRDLVIRLSWGGQADLDLRVGEPTGSICSCTNRQTVGGGTHIGDMLGDKNLEVYVAAQAFPGKYKITVDKVWGRPLGDKCQLQVIQHQGTDQETSRLLTVDFKDTNEVTLDLEGGRRTQSASVPPPSLQQTPEALDQGNSVSAMMARLRDVADPEVVGMARGFSGRAGSLGTPVQSVELERARDKDDRGKLKLQNRVSPFVDNNVSFTAQAVVDSDRRYVRLSVNAQFNVVTGTKLRPVVVPVIPGGRP